MSSSGPFTLLWGKILRSSIWMESKETRLLWITMLALKDKDGVVTGSVGGLAHTARISDLECAEGLEKFLSPDPDSGNPENEGRRIEKVPGGWRILNHEAYQFSSEARQMAWAEQKRIQRVARGLPPVADLDEPDESGTTPQQRMDRVKEKVVRAEAIEDSVRAKFNPGAAVNRTPIDPSEQGLTMRQIRNRRMKNDPITKADKKAVRKLPHRDPSLPPHDFENDGPTAADLEGDWYAEDSADSQPPASA